MKKIVKLFFVISCLILLSSCSKDDGKKKVELFIFKPESVKIFEQIARDFEKENPDIKVEVSAPGDAYAVLKTRIVKGKIPDLIGLGGEQYYVEYANSGIFEELTDHSIMEEINPGYVDSLKFLEGGDSVHGLPYVANVSGVIYNKDLFAKEGLEVPTTWSEFVELCEKLKSENKNPLYLGYKDDWTIMQAFNPLGANLMSDNAFDFSSLNFKKYNDEYTVVLEKLKQLNDFSQGDVFSYNYNDATIGFANGESYMYLQGNWAIPMIRQTNPKMNIDMFPFPAKDDEPSASVSGIDIVFSIAKKSKHPKETEKLLKYMISKDAYNLYVEDQFAIPTLKESENFPKEIASVVSNLEEGNIRLAPQYLFPSETGFNALIQTYLINNNQEAFIKELNKRLTIIIEQKGDN